MTKILKVAMLGPTGISLDGKPISLRDLETAFAVGARYGAIVRYYTDQPGTPASMNLINLVIKHQLAIQLASKPDCSDVVDLDELSAARAAAAPGKLVVIRPDTKVLVLPCSTEGVPPDAVAGMQRMIPPPQKVAVIAATAWASDAKPSVQASNQAIPFFGMLMGMSAIGNTVWISDGQLLAASCRGADLLIVDSDRLPSLPADWKQNATMSMHKPSILIHDRAGYRLRPA